jgi:hypothetical protein
VQASYPANLGSSQRLSIRPCQSLAYRFSSSSLQVSVLLMPLIRQFLYAPCWSADWSSTVSCGWAFNFVWSDRVQQLVAGTSIRSKRISGIYRQRPSVRALEVQVPDVLVDSGNRMSAIPVTCRAVRSFQRLLRTWISAQSSSPPNPSLVLSRLAILLHSSIIAQLPSRTWTS